MKILVCIYCNGKCFVTYMYSKNYRKNYIDWALETHYKVENIVSIIQFLEILSLYLSLAAKYGPNKCLLKWVAFLFNFTDHNQRNKSIKTHCSKPILKLLVATWLKTF